jgi:chitodextrinase
MAGQLTLDTLKASSGVLATQNGMTGIAKAWVNFNGSTAAIAAAFNVSSVTRVSTGIYTVTFTNTMPNANYSYQICARDTANGMGVPTVQADPDRSVTASALPIIYNYPPNTTYYDADTITVAVFSS